MKLPNADRAQIDLAKLRDYCLNPRHARGRHKARVFRAVLGYATQDAETLRDQILASVSTAAAAQQREDPFGRRFVVDCPIDGPRGSAVVRTAWIIPRGADIPHLTTCFVL